MSILFLHVAKMDIYIGFSLQIYVIQVRRKPTENLQKTYKKSGDGILFIWVVANCKICGTNLLTSELYIPTFASKTKVMKKRVSAVVIVLVCLGGVA